ncbi:hypothetical protein TorRG33x02_343580 [Trema orientale]|uniref:Uncharacterized protein n=1 Tax=Trema orientale TaxID=63057 RepID=A0A2P5ARB2_TREOI|nr:hypothetical protein TorRG33x02_343580 [Trema orientale]
MNNFRTIRGGDFVISQRSGVALCSFRNLVGHQTLEHVFALPLPLPLPLPLLSFSPAPNSLFSRQSSILRPPLARGRHRHRHRHRHPHPHPHPQPTRSLDAVSVAPLNSRISRHRRLVRVREKSV